MQGVPNNPPPARTRLGMFDINRVTRAGMELSTNSIR